MNDYLDYYTLPKEKGKFINRGVLRSFEFGNPIVGYSKLKNCIRLFFWSGASFDEEQLRINTGKFKDASIRYTSVDQINIKDLKQWIEKSRDIHWDYKYLIKRKGKLERLK